jgi:hypothetical protein
MRDIKEYVAGVGVKVADIAARAEVIKQESFVIALDLIEFTKEVETTVPPSDAKDELIAVLAALKNAMIELGALPPMAIPTSGGDRS